MAVSKVDPGQIYFITEMDQGTKKSTGYYKIGIVRNLRLTYDRIKEHQTANPHRLYAAEVIDTDAPLMVESMLHGKYNSKRASGEWFRFTPSELATVITEAKRLSGIYGPKLSALRANYSSTPSKGILTLSGKNLTDTENLRDKAYQLDKEIMELKYKMKTIEHTLEAATGTNGDGIDGVTYVDHKNGATKFNFTIWKKAATASQLKACEKPVSPKDDFRFLYPKNGNKAAKTDLANAHWKKELVTSFNVYDIAKSSVIKHPTSAFTETSVARTKLYEKMHEEYSEYSVKRGILEIKLTTIDLEIRLICQQYEGIAGICEWKRKPRPPEINESLMKNNFPADTINPRFMKTTTDTSTVKFYLYRPYV